MTKPIYAWHFTDGNKLRDGSKLPPVGETLKFDGKPILCTQGLHASLHPYDALKYAPGDTLHLVRCGGEILYQGDKLVCTERTIIASFEASAMLCYFARMQALSVVHLMPNVPDVVSDWLFTGNPASRSAAHSAAHSAATYAALAAAHSAALAAAHSAAHSAARSAAHSAALAAAHSAANSAALAAANSAATYAAYSAARSAAHSAATYAARQAFADLVYECFEGPMENIGFTGNP